MKQTIRLNESDIRRMVHEAVNRLIRESADSKDMINLKGERLMSTLKTVPNAVRAWAAAVQRAENKTAYDDFNAEDSSDAGEDMNNGSMEDDYGIDGEEMDDNSTSYKQDSSDVDKYYLPEYVALWALAVQSIYSDYNGRGFFNSSDITKMKNALLYDLTMQPDYITKTQASNMSDEELQNTLSVKSKGFLQVISPDEYMNLPKSEQGNWKRNNKGQAAGMYTKQRPIVDGQGNQHQPLISDEQIVKELADIVHFAFANGYVLKFAQKITHDAHPFESFKYTVRQAGVKYLKTEKKDTFLHTFKSDVSGDSNGDSDETSNKVPEELRDYQGYSNNNSDERAKKALKNLKCVFEWIAYKNNGRVQFKVGGSLNQKYVQYISMVIADNFDDIFDDETLGRMCNDDLNLSVQAKSVQDENKGQSLKGIICDELTKYCSKMNFTIPGTKKTITTIGIDKCREFCRTIFDRPENIQQLKQYKKEIFGTEDIYETRIRRIIRETIRRRLF